MRLVPTAERVAVLGFTLAKALARYPSVQLVAMCQMSNHLHLVLRDRAGKLSEVMQMFLSELAKRMNALDGLRGPLFERRFAEITIVDEEALLGRVAYVVTNPVAADLVRSHNEWTGLCVFAARGAWRQSFTYFEAGRYGRAVARARRRKEPLPGRAEFEKTVVLEVPAVEAAMAEAMEAAVKGRERALRAEQRGVVGMAKVLAESPLSRPKASSRSPKPLCFASTREGWWAFVVEWRAYVAAFRAASERFRAGVWTAVFPPGAFRPGVFVGT